MQQQFRNEQNVEMCIELYLTQNPHSNNTTLTHIIDSFGK